MDRSQEVLRSLHSSLMFIGDGRVMDTEEAADSLDRVGRALPGYRDALQRLSAFMEEALIADPPGVGPTPTYDAYASRTGDGDLDQQAMQPELAGQDEYRGFERARQGESQLGSSTVTSIWDRGLFSDQGQPQHDGRSHDNPNKSMDLVEETLVDEDTSASTRGSRKRQISPDTTTELESPSGSKKKSPAGLGAESHSVTPKGHEMSSITDRRGTNSVNSGGTGSPVRRSGRGSLRGKANPLGNATQRVSLVHQTRDGHSGVVDHKFLRQTSSGASNVMDCDAEVTSGTGKPRDNAQTSLDASSGDDHTTEFSPRSNLGAGALPLATTDTGMEGEAARVKAVEKPSAKNIIADQAAKEQALRNAAENRAIADKAAKEQALKEATENRAIADKAAKEQALKEAADNRAIADKATETENEIVREAVNEAAVRKEAAASEAAMAMLPPHGDLAHDLGTTSTSRSRQEHVAGSLQSPCFIGNGSLHPSVLSSPQHDNVASDGPNSTRMQIDRATDPNVSVSEVYLSKPVSKGPHSHGLVPKDEYMTFSHSKPLVQPRHPKKVEFLDIFKPSSKVASLAEAFQDGFDTSLEEESMSLGDEDIAAVLPKDWVRLRPYAASVMSNALNYLETVGETVQTPEVNMGNIDRAALMQEQAHDPLSANGIDSKSVEAVHRLFQDVERTVKNHSIFRKWTVSFLFDVIMNENHEITEEESTALSVPASNAPILLRQMKMLGLYKPNSSAFTSDSQQVRRCQEILKSLKVLSEARVSGCQFVLFFIDDSMNQPMQRGAVSAADLLAIEQFSAPLFRQVVAQHLAHAKTKGFRGRLDISPDSINGIASETPGLHRIWSDTSTSWATIGAGLAYAQEHGYCDLTREYQSTDSIMKYGIAGHSDQNASKYIALVKLLNNDLVPITLVGIKSNSFVLPIPCGVEYCMDPPIETEVHNVPPNISFNPGMVVGRLSFLPKVDAVYANISLYCDRFRDPRVPKFDSFRPMAYTSEPIRAFGFLGCCQEVRSEDTRYSFEDRTYMVSQLAVPDPLLPTYPLWLIAVAIVYAWESMPDSDTGAILDSKYYHNNLALEPDDMVPMAPDDYQLVTDLLRNHIKESPLHAVLPTDQRYTAHYDYHVKQNLKPMFTRFGNDLGSLSPIAFNIAVSKALHRTPVPATSPRVPSAATIKMLQNKDAEEYTVEGLMSMVNPGGRFVPSLLPVRIQGMKVEPRYSNLVDTLQLVWSLPAIRNLFNGTSRWRSPVCVDEAWTPTPITDWQPSPDNTAQLLPEMAAAIVKINDATISTMYRSGPPTPVDGNDLMASLLTLASKLSGTVTSPSAFFRFLRQMLFEMFRQSPGPIGNAITLHLHTGSSSSVDDALRGADAPANTTWLSFLRQCYQSNFADDFYGQICLLHYCETCNTFEYRFEHFDHLDITVYHPVSGPVDAAAALKDHFLSVGSASSHHAHISTCPNEGSDLRTCKRLSVAPKILVLHFPDVRPEANEMRICLPADLVFNLSAVRHSNAESAASVSTQYRVVNALEVTILPSGRRGTTSFANHRGVWHRCCGALVDRLEDSRVCPPEGRAYSIVTIELLDSYSVVNKGLLQINSS